MFSTHENKSWNIISNLKSEFAYRLMNGIWACYPKNWILKIISTTFVYYGFYRKKSISSKKAKIFRNAEKVIDISIVYKTSQSFKYANVTISAKGPAYYRRVSCGYAERSPLHFVLWLELFFFE